MYELGLLFLLGLAMGSFLTVVAERYDSLYSVVVGRSACNHCEKKLAWWELIPVASYLLLKGICTKCNKRIPALYPYFELLTGIAFAMVWLASPALSLALVLNFAIVCILMTLLITDTLSQSFPLSLLIIAAVAVVGERAIASQVYENLTQPITVLEPGLRFLSSPSGLIASSAFGLVVGVAALGVLAFPSRGKWMGYGDVILIAILGFWLGYPYVGLALMLAFYSGAVVGLIQLQTGKKHNHRIAFGPFLIMSGIVVFAYGNFLMSKLFQLWGIV